MTKNIQSPQNNSRVEEGVQSEDEWEAIDVSIKDILNNMMEDLSSDSNAITVSSQTANSSPVSAITLQLPIMPHQPISLESIDGSHGGGKKYLYNETPMTRNSDHCVEFDANDCLFRENFPIPKGQPITQQPSILCKNPHSDAKNETSLTVSGAKAKILQPSYMQKKGCGFCKSNGEQPFYYNDHKLKDATGKIICPILAMYKCPHCKEEKIDKRPHTAKYCPKARNQDAC